MTKKLCILLIEESETATTHDKVITEMVSPSQDTNPDFPWFMTVDPTTSRPFYVKCESMESQWPDPRQQDPPPIVILPVIDVPSDLLGLVAQTVVWPDGQIQHILPLGVSTRQERMREHRQSRPIRWTDTLTKLDSWPILFSVEVTVFKVTFSKTGKTKTHNYL